MFLFRVLFINEVPIAITKIDENNIVEVRIHPDAPSNFNAYWLQASARTGEIRDEAIELIAREANLVKVPVHCFHTFGFVE